MMRYALNQTVRLECRVDVPNQTGDAYTLTNASAITARVFPPASSAIAPFDVAPVPVATGVYQLDTVGTAAGLWRVRWSFTASGKAGVAWDSFYVEAPQAQG